MLTSPVLSGMNLDLAYGMAGNITSKTGAGDYYYESLQPHALTHIDRPDNSVDTFAYDDNGNLTSGADKTITWTSYNYPETVSRGGSTVTFQYGPNRQPNLAPATRAPPSTPVFGVTVANKNDSH